MKSNRKNKQYTSFDDEDFLLENFRLTRSSRIKYFGRFFQCTRVKWLLKSFLFKKSWINSSADSRPDFHNDKHRIMMEMMRIDDCVGERNGKQVPNSFKRKDLYFRKHLGNKYEDLLKSCTLFFNADTTNDDEFNFEGYFKNFKKVLMKHSEKVDAYHSNYPKCKKCILFIFDESNAYYQEGPLNGNLNKINLIHTCFLDKQFIDVIKQCKSDFVVWFTFNKTILNEKQKEIKRTLACIYDIKHMRRKGITYDYRKMRKIV